jgi:prenyltransferase beta subunit
MRLQNKDDLAYHLTAHLRLNAVYWGLTALCVMGHKDALDRTEMIEFVMSCWDEDAGSFALAWRRSRLTLCLKELSGPIPITTRIFSLR